MLSRPSQSCFDSALRQAQRSAQHDMAGPCRSTPSISAIIVNYRTPRETLRCVEALERQTIAGDIEIIIVDNHSGDRSVPILRQLLGKDSRVRILETTENMGYARGNNLGAASAHGAYLLIVNPDTTLEPDALEKMRDFLATHPDVGIIGPKLRLPDGTIRDSSRTFPTITDLFLKRTFLRFFFPRRMRQYLQWGKDPHEQRDVDWLVGACLFLRRELFEELGGFDPRFFLFFEDTDLCRRSALRGKRIVYFPAAKADDGEQRLSSGGSLSFFTKKTVRIHFLSALKYFWKWGPQP